MWVERVLGMRTQQNGTARAGLFLFGSARWDDVVHDAPVLLTPPTEYLAQSCREQEKKNIP